MLVILAYSVVPTLKLTVPPVPSLTLNGLAAPVVEIKTSLPVPLLTWLIVDSSSVPLGPSDHNGRKLVVPVPVTVPLLVAFIWTVLVPWSNNSIPFPASKLTLSIVPSDPVNTIL